MKNFQIGDLVEFLPEEFNHNIWTFRLIGIGYVENITHENNSKGKEYIFYHVYCSKVVKQQIKNFVEIEVKDKIFKFVESEMEKVCKKLNR